MKYQELPIVFDCEDNRLVGIVTKPEFPSNTGILIVVGGPQYRAGSHRQFTLLARYLARSGYPSCRFDYRGMGDSEGEMRNFETVNEDIKAAINAFLVNAGEVKQIVIWGLCDAASAALYYAYSDARVKGLVLLNPWVHTEAGEGRMRVKHYYAARFFQKSFWLKLLSGQVRLGVSTMELLKSVQLFFTKNNPSNDSINTQEKALPFIDRMLKGLKLYSGNILFILSKNDLGAQEFTDLLQTNKVWKQACQSSKVEISVVPEANHTFSSKTWRDQAAQLTEGWLNK